MYSFNTKRRHKKKQCTFKRFSGKQFHFAWNLLYPPYTVKQDRIMTDKVDRKDRERERKKKANPFTCKYIEKLHRQIIAMYWVCKLVFKSTPQAVLSE